MSISFYSSALTVCVFYSLLASTYVGGMRGLLHTCALFISYILETSTPVCCTPVCVLSLVNTRKHKNASEAGLWTVVLHVASLSDINELNKPGGIIHSDN